MNTMFYEDDNGRQNRNCLIVVEGLDDVFFLSKLLEEINADPSIVGIVEVKGKTNFVKFLARFLKSSYFTQGLVKTIAVICDADHDAKKAEAEVREAFSGIGKPDVTLGSFVTASSGVRVGLFALPNSSDPGDLEKLCMQTVDGHELKKGADDFVSLAQKFAEQQNEKFNGSIHKRTVQVFLAGVASEIVRGAGRAYSVEIFDKNHDSLKPLRNFLQTMIAFPLSSS